MIPVWFFLIFALKNFLCAKKLKIQKLIKEGNHKSLLKNEIDILLWINKI